MNTSLRVFSSLLLRPQLMAKRYCSSIPKEESKVSIDVPGLTTKVVNVPDENVGPGAGKNTDYKNPEYFCYDKTSYFEAEIEMLKYRLPQPSSIQQQ